MADEFEPTQESTTTSPSTTIPHIIAAELNHIYDRLGILSAQLTKLALVHIDNEVNAHWRSKATEAVDLTRTVLASTHTCLGVAYKILRDPDPSCPTCGAHTDFRLMSSVGIGGERDERFEEQYGECQKCGARVDLADIEQSE